MRSHSVLLACRSLFQRPGFAASAILLVALAAGANAAVFSVVRGILLRPLPFDDPERLVAVWPDKFVSNRDIGFFRDRLRGLREVAGVAPGFMMAFVAEGREPLRVTGDKVSDNTFSMLGARAALGRTIQPGDGPVRVVVLTHDIWTRAMGADPAAVGRTVLIDQQPYEIVGVMRPGFEILGPGTDLWVPFPFDPSSSTHTATFCRAFGRLAPGATIDGVSSEIAALGAAMRRELSLPDDWGRTLRVASLHETVVGDASRTLLVLLGAVGLILLLGGINLGTLVLGRSVARAREMAVRTALGASRTRLVRQILLEQGVLAVLGSVAGIGLAGLLLPLLVARMPADLPRIADISLDTVVVAAVLAASIGVSLLTAIGPAVLTARVPLQLLVRSGHGNDTPGRRRALSALVSAQVALALVLGIGAGLMLRSMWNLQQVDPGFDAPRVLSFRLQTTSKYRALGPGLPYLERVVERVRALPGVEAVGAINHLPMSGYSWTMAAWPEEQVLPPGATPPWAGWRFIGWDYFQAMRIPLKGGRFFSGTDQTTSPRVVIVNETFARKFFGEPSAAVGRGLRMSIGAQQQQSVEIVGVVGDVRHNALSSPPAAEIYRPLAQTFMFPMAMVVRTAGPPAQLAAAVREIAYASDSAVPIAELQPLSALLADSLGRQRLLARLLVLFAAIGLLLSVIGVYGVVAYQVRQQEREIGVRLALGAPPRGIVAMVVRDGSRLAIAGLLAGIPAALLLAGVMQGVVFGIAPHDPATFVVLPAVVLAATLAASYLPARRASAVDPLTTIKRE